MTSQRVLLLASFADSLINFRGPLIEELTAAGHEVHVCAPGLTANAALAKQLRAFGAVMHEIPLSRTGTSPLADLRSLWRLFQLMRKIKPDLVLAYTIKPVVYGMIAGWLAGVERRFAMITGLGYAFIGESNGKRGRTQLLARALYRLALARASGVFFQNPDDRELFERMGLIGETVPVTLINGSGVDLNRFEEQALPALPIRFLMIARLLGDKGVREYAAAARIVRSSHPKAEFHLVGGEDSNPDAIPLGEIEGWQKDGILIWHGEVADVRPSLAEAHVYVLPSYREGTPRTVLEAMATGRPVITTDAPGCRETIVNGESGYLVPVRKSDPLASTMMRFVTDPKLVGRMGRAARERAVEKYDVRLVNRQIRDAMGL
ncbi:MAG: glycosyltransferase family 4 protein [Pseudomonadota bacterium]